MAQPLPRTDEFKEWLRKNHRYANTDPEIEKRESFTPISEVKIYLGENHLERLEVILEELFGDDEPPDAQTILNSYVAVFCTLVEIDKARAIADFVQKELHDQRSFDPNHEPEGFPQHGGGGSFYERFCAKQWKFCVPKFEKNLDKHFKPNRILPIVRKRKIGEGGSATLYEIMLHGSYNFLPSHELSAEERTDPSRNTFALKTYLAPDAAQHYESEVGALRKLSRAQNSHLISFYGNYIQGNSHNIILEYADEGTLEQYFQKIAPPRDAEDIIKFWTGLSSVLKALHSIHNVDLRGEGRALNGWHQDVKPANILVISKGESSPYDWKFKLADLGLSHFTKTFGGAHADAAADVYGTQSYGAPECFRSDDFWDNVN